jgi:asparagine synthase (glutamine-hydrolysing)
MCGLAGIIRWKQPLLGQAAGEWRERVTAAAYRADGLLQHRGPDGSGQWNNFSNPTHGPQVSLVHRRLSIIDPVGGHQPMANEDGTVYVVFNGEIYNHAELRKELLNVGHRFMSDHCDTEVLVHGWEQWKTDLPGRLRGMYAFTIWDAKEQTAFLARDYFGQKPLFYADSDDQLVFGSTLPSVRCWPGVEAQASLTALRQYLQWGYIPPPDTIYTDIKCVRPGSWILWNAGRRTEAAFWQPGESLLKSGAAINVAREEDIQELRQLIFSAVESQLRADVPLICFLSGGIDSAVVCGVAHQLGSGESELQAVTVGFEESAFDEMPLAVQTAKALKLRHHQCRVNMKSSALATLDWLMEFALGQPFADSSILPTYWVANATRRFAPCALSGDGGDELFGGYDRYRAARLLAAGFRLPRLNYRSERLRRLALAGSQRGWREQYAALCRLFVADDLTPLAWADESSRYAGQSGMDVIRQCMLNDQSNYLPGDVLWKVDSASMACGLEVRSPLLDHHLANWANRFSGGAMMNWRHGKLLLRRAMGDFIPQSVQRGRKRGFGAPIGQWFRQSLRASAEMIILSPGALHNSLNMTEVVRRIWHEHLAGQRDHTHRIFAWLMLELWHRQNSNVVWK